MDASRLGIWGGSYGGYLTALALARNSDVFAAGVDIHGVHDWVAQHVRYGDFLLRDADIGRRPPDYARAMELAWTSSPLADIDRWRSPVLLIHGDDDRNVHVSQTVDAQLAPLPVMAQGHQCSRELPPQGTHAGHPVAKARRTVRARKDGGGRRSLAVLTNRPVPHPAASYACRTQAITSGVMSPTAESRT